MLRLLETFCAVAEAGSLNKAAELLNLTQPAITRHIKSLEAEMGAVLLRRTAQGVELTPAGKAMLPHARQVLAGVDTCRRAAGEAASGARDQLRIATGITVMNYHLADVLAIFRQRRPEVEVSLFPGHPQEVVERLLAYQADVGLFAATLSQPGIRHIPLFADPFVLITAPGDARAPQPITMAELRGLTVFVPPPQSGQRTEIDRALEQSAVACRLTEYPTVETLKTAVSLGLGVAIVPASSVREEVSSGRLSRRPIADWPVPQRVIRAVVRSEGQVAETVRDLITLLRERYDEGGEVQP